MLQFIQAWKLHQLILLRLYSLQITFDRYLASKTLKCCIGIDTIEVNDRLADSSILSVARKRVAMIEDHVTDSMRAKLLMIHLHLSPGSKLAHRASFVND